MTLRLNSRGQALVEALVGMAALAVLLLLLSMVDRVQDLGLRASHASRYLALALTRRDSGPELQREVVDRFFDPRGNRWVTRHGISMIDEAGGNVRVRQEVGDMSPESQIGAGHADAGVLRNELLFRDKGIMTGRVELVPRMGPGADHGPQIEGILGLLAWDRMHLTVPRHTSILTGPGHAGDDRAVTARIASSDHAWRLAASRSEQAGRRATASLRSLDAPWDRPEPDFDWLRAWEDVVPEDRLGSGRGGR
jgi:hypothetical protein